MFINLRFSFIVVFPGVLDMAAVNIWHSAMFKAPFQDQYETEMKIDEHHLEPHQHASWLASRL